MFRAMADGIVRFPKVSEFAGIDTCFDVRVWPNSGPHARKPIPARGANGRFLPRARAEPDAEVKESDNSKPWNDVPNWTPEQRFMFDLEGDLYKLTALATTLERLLTPLTNDMAGHDRLGAALDYAATNLADAVEEIEERYKAVRFPDKQAA